MWCLFSREPEAIKLKISRDFSRNRRYSALPEISQESNGAKGGREANCRYSMAFFLFCRSASGWYWSTDNQNSSLPRQSPPFRALGLCPDKLSLLLGYLFQSATIRWFLLPVCLCGPCKEARPQPNRHFAVGLLEVIISPACRSVILTRLCAPTSQILLSMRLVRYLFEQQSTQRR